MAYSGKSKCRFSYLTAQNSSHLKYSNITLHGLHVLTTGGSKEIAICGDNWLVENCQCSHATSSTDGPGILLVPTADSGHEGRFGLRAGLQQHHHPQQRGARYPAQRGEGEEPAK